MELGLIDEHRFVVCTGVRGAGKPLFLSVATRHSLRLTKAEQPLNGASTFGALDV